MISEIVKKILADALAKTYPEMSTAVHLEKTADPAHGDYATNSALVLAKKVSKKPREVAEEIIKNISDADSILESVTIAGPGFINFKLKDAAWIGFLKAVSEQKAAFGFSKKGQGQKVVVEFVSANPTGPLHIGNARGGPLGDVISSLLQAVGYQVTREFYLNDIGGQIDKLGSSILARIGEIMGQGEVDKEAIGYQGEYVKELAQLAIDEQVKQDVLALGLFGIEKITAEIKRDCDDMGIHFDTWVYEKDIVKKTPAIIDSLKTKNVTQEKDGALWFVPQDEFLNDRECVLIKSDGMPTYFSNDITYHVDKYQRGFDRLINVWGSNHHGHVPRVQAGVKAFGFDPQKLETVLYQYVRVKRGNDAVKMSKRGGNFVLAREVLDEVGKDALRFFLLSRSPEAHLDFDLELAKKTSSDNPVYYVQYAHARICSLFQKALEAGHKAPDGFKNSYIENLKLPEEIALSRSPLSFPELIDRSASEMTPHKRTTY